MPPNPEGLCWDSPTRASQRLPAVPDQPLPLQAPLDWPDLLAQSIWFGWIQGLGGNMTGKLGAEKCGEKECGWALSGLIVP